MKMLPKLARQGEVMSWESGKFATFEFDNVDPTSLAHWLDAYFVDILDCVPGEYNLDVSYEEMG
jgi:hypothetical protein